MERVSITEEQLLDALRSAVAAISQPDDLAGTFSLREVCEQMRIGEHAARRLVRSLLSRGEAEVVSVLQRNMVGVVMHRPRYKLVPGGTVSQD